MSTDRSETDDEALGPTDVSGIRRIAQDGVPDLAFHQAHCAALVELARYVDALIANHDDAALDMSLMTEDLVPFAHKLAQLGTYVNEGCRLAKSLSSGDLTIMQSDTLAKNPLIPPLEIIRDNLAHSLKLARTLASGEFSVQGGEGGESFSQAFNEALDEMRARQRELERSAYTDSLTGADNRAAYAKKLDELWGAKDPFAIAFVDIDNLKGCNDRFGHDEGDLYISQTYLYLKLFLNDEDDIFRVGGDEFIVISPQADEEVLARALEGCRESLVKNSSGPDDSMTFSFSYGCSRVDPTGGDTRQQMTLDADRKMYAYKLAHKGRSDTAPASAPTISRFGIDDRVFEALSMASAGRYLFVFDIATGDSRWSPNAVRDLGLPGEHIHSTVNTLRPYIHPDDLAAHESDLNEVLHGRKHRRAIQYRMLNAEGNYVMCDCHGFRLDADGAHPALFVGVVVNHDVVESSDSVTGLPNIRGLVNAVGESRQTGGPTGFVVVRAEGIDRYNAMYGYAEGDKVLRAIAERLVSCSCGRGQVFRGRGVQMVLVAQTADAEELAQLVHDVHVRLREPMQVAGETFTLTTHVASQFYPAVTQQPFVVLRSLDERLATTARIEQAAEQGEQHDTATGASQRPDPLTGLARGSEFLKRANAYRMEHREDSLCLVKLDIGYLRMFNEWHGRAEGDKLLTDIGRVLRAEEKAGDAVAGYWGQDDFTLLVPSRHSRVEAVYARAEAVVAAHDTAIGFRPSLGVYVLDSDEEVGIDQYSRAAFADNQAKQSLSNRIAYFSPLRYDQEERQRNLLVRFQHALGSGQITFYLQPQCELNSRLIIGAEALARWLRPDGTPVPPAEFVPTLESTGFVTMLDKHVWHAVFDWLHGRLSRGETVVPVSVNVSRVDIAAIDVAECLESLARQHEVPTSLVKVEITETTYVSNEDAVTALAERLHEAGFAVYMDDFGSGQSSLNMLKTTPVDVIKLDRGFMPRDPEEVSKSLSILRSVVGMARMLKLPMIVEGVETEEQAGLLHKLGIRYVQGFLYWKPLPVADFEKLLDGGKAISEPTPPQAFVADGAE